MSRDGYRFEALSQQESGRSYFTGKDKRLGFRHDLAIADMNSNE